MADANSLDVGITRAERAVADAHGQAYAYDPNKRRTHLGIMPVIKDQITTFGGIMPDHVGDRGAAHLDPGASRSPTYQAEAEEVSSPRQA